MLRYGLLFWFVLVVCGFAHGQEPSVAPSPDYEGTREALLARATQDAARLQAQSADDIYALTATQLIIEATQTIDPTYTGASQAVDEPTPDLTPVILFVLGLAIGAGGVWAIISGRRKRKK